MSLVGASALMGEGAAPESEAPPNRAPRGERHGCPTELRTPSERLGIVKHFGPAERAVPDDAYALLNPVVLVEVLSESTEAYDRGAKAAHYRRIESLAEYVLVSQSEPLIEVHRRNERGHFELIEARPGERAELASLGISISVDAVCEDPLQSPAPAG